MTKHQARMELAKILIKDPAIEFSRPDPRVTLEWFWLHRFKPLAEANWRPSTQKSFLYLVEKHILRKFGECKLCDLQVFEIQNHINELSSGSLERTGQAQERKSLDAERLSPGVGGCRRAQTDSGYQGPFAGYSKSTILHVRKLIKQILNKAVELEYLERNPAAKLTVPKKLKPSPSRVLTLEEIGTLERGLKGRERMIFRMLVLLGLRPGELFARRWRDWQGEKLLIEDAVFRGVIDEPKTKGSKAFVWLPKILQRDLEAFWRSLASPDLADFIVSPAHGCVSRPLDTHNYLRRVFKPACEALGVKDVTHQCLRRTCSTYLLPHGTIKDVQGHLRHMSTTTTLDIYAREIPESVKRAVEEMTSWPRFHMTTESSIDCSIVMGVSVVT